jgi:hypothetical protein
MKPRIYRRDGIWICRSIDAEGWMCLGYGYTPKQAFKEWEAYFGPSSLLDRTGREVA